ncbi:MAG: hypothetical protein R6U86_06270 [Bacteroidales bacterium]
MIPFHRRSSLRRLRSFRTGFAPWGADSYFAAALAGAALALQNFFKISNALVPHRLRALAR